MERRVRATARSGLVLIVHDWNGVDDYEQRLQVWATSEETLTASAGGSGQRTILWPYILAGLFLREFVGDYPWVHIDIAGTAYGDGKLPYQVKGSTGAPTRLFVEWVLGRVP